MIDNSWRELLYPLGFLASLAFGARFILQWLKSERLQKSVVSPSFWKLSLTGNTLLFVHSFIQMQFHVCLIQVVNGVISWRNLNLMKTASQRYKTRSVIFLLIGITLLTVTAFFVQSTLNPLQESSWFRVPNPKVDGSSIGFGWHLIGFFGLALFNSRFWIQWWNAEKTETSSISRSFWWISLAGAAVTLAYFIHIKDYVNIIGPGIGIIPYIRNLMLLSKSKAPSTVMERS